MRQIKVTLKRMLAPVMLIAAVFAMSFAAQAALAKPTIVGIEAGESNVKLTYTKVSGATGYAVYRVDPETGVKMSAEPINKNSLSALKDSSSVTISGLENGKQYAFRIAAVSGTDISELSNKMTAVPKVKNPGKMVNARVSATGNQSVTLSWTRLDSATGYIIYQRNSKNKYKKLTTVRDGNATAFTVTGLTNNKTYYFKICAIRTVDGKTVKGSKSAALKGKPTNVSAAAKKVHTYYSKVTVAETTTAKQVNGTGRITLKKGRVIKVLKRTKGYTGYSYFKKNGVKYKVASKYLNYDSYRFVTRTKAYSNKVATEFVNYKGYKSSTEYLIWISTYTQHFYIFKGSQYKWTLWKTDKCSTGMAGTFISFQDGVTVRRSETPLGKTKISGKQQVWIFDANQYAYWASRIAGGAIHSWLYYPDTMEKWAAGTLGKPASHGCVRVDIVYSKLIYDTCPVGTTVIVY